MKTIKTILIFSIFLNIHASEEKPKHIDPLQGCSFNNQATNNPNKLQRTRKTIVTGHEQTF